MLVAENIFGGVETFKSKSNSLKVSDACVTLKFSPMLVYKRDYWKIFEIFEVSLL